MESECNPFHQSAVTPGSVTALATRVGSSPGYERPAAQAVLNQSSTETLLTNLVYNLSKERFHLMRAQNA